MRAVSVCNCGSSWEAELPVGVDDDPRMASAALYFATKELLEFKEAHTVCRTPRRVILREVIDALDTSCYMELESAAGWLENRYENELKELP